MLVVLLCGVRGPVAGGGITGQDKAVSCSGIVGCVCCVGKGGLQWFVLLMQ